MPRYHEIDPGQAAISGTIDAGKSVPLHEGPYLGYLRYHLGLRVPKDDPPRLVVRGEEYVWQEGEGVLFDDSWPHQVINRSIEPRVVLIVDVMRPLPFLPSLVNAFVFQALARPFYLRRVWRRVQGTPLLPTA